MNIEFIVQNTETGTIFDISEIVQDITFESEMEESPGKLEFNIIRTDNQEYVSEGSPVSFKIGNNGVFFGYVFKIKKSDKKKIEVVAYDQIRYFKIKDTYVLDKMSAEEVFKKICTESQIKYKVVNGTTHKLPERIEDNKSRYEVLQYALDKTLIDTGSWLFIRDNFGTLELLDVSKQKTDLVIGDESLLLEYEYESSIDDDTYNQVKIVKENKETKKRDTYIVKDSNTIKKWGLLQHYETVTDNLNDAQLKEKAEKLLKQYNKAKKTFSLNCLGDLRVKAGTGVVILIEDLKNDFIYNKYVIVTKVKHEFKKNKHTMDLDVRWE